MRADAVVLSSKLWKCDTLGKHTAGRISAVHRVPELIVKRTISDTRNCNDDPQIGNTPAAC